MKKILIATHGTFASGAESTVKFLMGDVGNITCINAYVDQDENLAETLEQYFARVQSEDQVIVLTGIKGGSVNQKIVPYAVRENVFLIAGFNLPLLVALAIAPQGITREDVRQYIEDSKKQMELVELEADDSRDEDFFA